LGLVAGTVLATGFLCAAGFSLLGGSGGDAQLLGALVLLGLGPAAALAIADLLQGQLSPRRCLVGTLVCAAAAPILGVVSFLLVETFELGWGGLPLFATSFLAIVAEAWRRL
jgi:hypothetical protein